MVDIVFYPEDGTKASLSTTKDTEIRFLEGKVNGEQKFDPLHSPPKFLRIDYDGDLIARIDDHKLKIKLEGDKAPFVIRNFLFNKLTIQKPAVTTKIYVIASTRAELNVSFGTTAEIDIEQREFYNLAEDETISDGEKFVINSGDEKSFDNLTIKNNGIFCNAGTLRLFGSKTIEEGGQYIAEEGSEEIRY